MLNVCLIDGISTSEAATLVSIATSGVVLNITLYLQGGAFDVKLDQPKLYLLERPFDKSKLSAAVFCSRISLGALSCVRAISHTMYSSVTTLLSVALPV